MIPGTFQWIGKIFVPGSFQPDHSYSPTFSQCEYYFAASYGPTYFNAEIRRLEHLNGCWKPATVCRCRFVFAESMGRMTVIGGISARYLWLASKQCVLAGLNKPDLGEGKKTVWSVGFQVCLFSDLLTQRSAQRVHMYCSATLSVIQVIALVALFASQGGDTGTSKNDQLCQGSKVCLRIIFIKDKACKSFV